MALKFRKKLILAKIQPSAGVDAAPTGADNAILTSNLTITPLAGDTISRGLDRPTLGNDEQIHVGSHVTCTFDVEIAGEGAAGTAPAYGPVLRGCGIDETINVAVDVEYKPISTGEEMLTIHMFFDGQKHAMLDAMGSVSRVYAPGAIPKYSFSFVGVWVDPTAEADPTPDWSEFQVPNAVNNTNTPTFTLHGYSGNMLRLELDQANQVVHRDVVGQESVQIVDRAPAGRVTIEAPALGTKNFFTIAKANTTGALQLVHGTTAGNIVQEDATLVQLLNPRYGDSDGIRTLEMDLSLVPSSAGDDDFQITVR